MRTFLLGFAALSGVSAFNLVAPRSQATVWTRAAMVSMLAEDEVRPLSVLRSTDISMMMPAEELPVTRPELRGPTQESANARAGECEMRFGPGKCIFRGDKCTGKRCKVNSAPCKVNHAS